MDSWQDLGTPLAVKGLAAMGSGLCSGPGGWVVDETDVKVAAMLLVDCPLFSCLCSPLGGVVAEVVVVVVWLVIDAEVLVGGAVELERAGVAELTEVLAEACRTLSAGVGGFGSLGAELSPVVSWSEAFSLVVSGGSRLGVVGSTLTPGCAVGLLGTTLTSD
jgi:hypothetical protein